MFGNLIYLIRVVDDANINQLGKKCLTNLKIRCPATFLREQRLYDFQFARMILSQGYCLCQ